MRPHFHTDVVQLGMTTLGVLVFIHVMQLVAIKMSDSGRLSGAGKALAAFALAH
jgi:hypothetical protein